jgi:hypothetical protein
MNSYRRSLLEHASFIVEGDRNVDYGDPSEDFRRTSAYWNIHVSSVFLRKAHQLGMPVSDELKDLLESTLDAHDVAIMMMQLKHSRLAWSPTKMDHWVDAAGYAACGYECVELATDAPVSF